MTKIATKPASTIADLSPVAIIALSKMLTKKVIDDARDQLEAGEQDVELVLHLRGTIEIQDDADVMQVNRLDPMMLFQIAMDKLNGVSIDSVVAEASERLHKKNLARIAKQKALEAEAKGKKVKLPEVEDEPEIREIKERVTEAYERLAKKTLQRRRGAVSFDGDLTPAEA
jgi:hypothetical protein